MALLYALPSLTNWQTVGGWSTSSGGAPSGSIPNDGSEIVFDANSGPARTITLPANGSVCRSITTAGANNITLTGTLNLYHTLNNVADFSGLSSATRLWLTLRENTAFSNFSLSIIPGNIVFTNITNTVPTNTLTLLGDLFCEGQLSPQGGGISVDVNGHNLTVSNLGSFSAFNNIYLRGGTLVLTGSGTVMSSNVNNLSSVGGGGTIKLTNTSSDIKTIGVALNTGSTTQLNLVLETGSGSGAVNLTGANKLNNLFLRYGSSLVLPASTNTQVASMTADGTGGMINISSSTPGTAATLTKTGGGTVDVNYCNIKDITASPADTFTARNSKNLGNNTNWTFIPPNDRFFQFL